MLLPVIRFGDLSPAGNSCRRRSRTVQLVFYTLFTGAFRLSPPRFSTFFSTAVENLGGGPTEARGKSDSIPERTDPAIDTLDGGSLVFNVSPFDRSLGRGSRRL